MKSNDIDRFAIRQKAYDFRMFLGIDENQAIKGLQNIIENELMYELHHTQSLGAFAGFTHFLTPYLPCIVFNKKHYYSDTFYRFTLAHELGHTELHRDRLMSGESHGSLCYDPKVDYLIEREADYFAISFLAPHQGFRRLISGLQPSADDVSRVASHFEISLYAVLIRFVELTDESSCLYTIERSSGRILYSSASRKWLRDYGVRFMSGQYIGEYSLSSGFVKNASWASLESKDGRLSDWLLRCEDDRDVTEVVYPKSYGTSQLVVLVTIL